MPHLSPTLLSPSPSHACDLQQYEPIRDILDELFAAHKIGAHVIDMEANSRYVMFKVEVDKYQRVSALQKLEDDIMTRTGATSVKLEILEAGDHTLGIYIPRKEHEQRNLRELIESDEYRNFTGDLPWIIGRDQADRPVIEDLALMPHVLIAGSAGSGKSIFIDSMILSFLFKLTPAELQLVLINTGSTDLLLYSKLPHLHMPIMTSTYEAFESFDRIYEEMDRRLELMAKVRVRNIHNYNETMAELGKPEEKLPRIVVIIDDIRDLMQDGGKQLSDSITKMTSKARATGIHFVLVTHNPTNAILTGEVTANLMCRVAFTVASNAESRTILHVSGAEKLLGEGDLLYHHPALGHTEHVQGAYVSDQEIEKVIQELNAI